MIDLDDLERLERAATPGKWDWYHEAGDPVPILTTSGQGPQTFCMLTPEDAALAVSLRNAAPELIRRAREWESLVAVCRELSDVWGTGDQELLLARASAVVGRVDDVLKHQEEEIPSRSTR